MAPVKKKNSIIEILIEGLVDGFKEKDPDLDLYIIDGSPVVAAGTSKKLIGLLFELAFLGKNFNFFNSPQIY